MQLPPPPIAPPELLHHDGYQAQVLPECGAESVDFFHVVVKRTFTLEPDAPARPAVWQHPLRLSDVFYDGQNPLRSSLRYETDLLPPKSACDVLVNGHVYAPGGEAVQVVAGLRVGDNPWKRVRVIGDRAVWLPRGQRRAQLSAARPFTVRPLIYEFAYGGIDLLAGSGPVPYPKNPVGMGFFVAAHEGGTRPDLYGPLPNFELLDQPLDVDALLVDPMALEAGPDPAGFGPIAKHWVPRAQKAGLPKQVHSFLEMLQKTLPGKPSLPSKTLDPAFLNGAPPGQVIPFPAGGETVVLEHLHPTIEQFRFRLPAFSPRVRLDVRDGFEPVSVKIDTVLIEPDRMMLNVVWRGSLKAAEGTRMDKLKKTNVEIDGELVLPAALLGTGFPLELLTEGKP